MKKISKRRESAEDSHVKTPVVHWGPIAAGIGLAVVFIAVVSFMPLSTIALVAGVFVVVAIAAVWKGLDGVLFVRWWARTVGMAFGLLLATIFLGESIGGHGPPMTTFGDIASLAPWMVLFIGLVITFFWEGIGGALVALAALVEQGNVLVVAHGELNPFIMVFVFVGLAFVYCWWRLRRLSLTHQLT